MLMPHDDDFNVYRKYVQVRWLQVDNSEGRKNKELLREYT